MRACVKGVRSVGVVDGVGSKLYEREKRQCFRNTQNDNIFATSMVKAKNFASELIYDEMIMGISAVI